jgi:glutaredoxin 3
MYTKSNCPYCVRAKSLLHQKAVPFEEINLEGKDQELQALQQKSGLKTVPQIFINDKLIGGYTDLATLEQNGELDSLLA